MNYKKNINNKFEYDKLSGKKNLIFKNKNNPYQLFNKKKLTKKKSSLNQKREKLISGKKISSNNPKKFITKRPKEINNYNSGTTRTITKKLINNENENLNYCYETVLSSPGKNCDSIKKLKKAK